jgi:hypothetical protein
MEVASSWVTLVHRNHCCQCYRIAVHMTCLRMNIWILDSQTDIGPALYLGCHGLKSHRGGWLLGRGFFMVSVSPRSEIRRCSPPASSTIWCYVMWASDSIVKWPTLLDKLILAQLVRKFIPFYATMVTTARHWPLSWARWIQSVTSHPISLKSILMLPHSQSLDLKTGTFSEVFLSELVSISPISCPSHPWFDHHNIWLALYTSELMFEIRNSTQKDELTPCSWSGDAWLSVCPDLRSQMADKHDLIGQCAVDFVLLVIKMLLLFHCEPLWTKINSVSYCHVRCWL